MRRVFGITFGLTVQAVFLLTVWQLFWFLKGSLPSESRWSFALDLALALQFCLPHSLLLLPAVRGRIERTIPTAFYGSFYCLVTCISLNATIGLWQTSPTAIVRVTGIGATLVTAGFYLSWVSLFYSLSLTGFGYQTGWTTWWAWFRRQSLPRREFRPRGAYLWLRHPVYLSFMGLIWFNPTVTLDRVLLMTVWSTYIFVGSYLKDRRLVFYLGDAYRTYQARVRGYPLFAFGPLARIPWKSPPPPEQELSSQREYRRAG